MTEIIFEVTESPEGGYEAKALGQSIYTDGNSVEELKANIEDAVICHFEPEELPKIVRMHFVRDEVFTVA